MKTRYRESKLRRVSDLVSMMMLLTVGFGLSREGLLGIGILFWILAGVEFINSVIDIIDTDYKEGPK